MAVVRNLMLRASSDFSGMSRGMKQAQRATKKFRRDFARTAKRIMQVSVAMSVAVAYASNKAIKAAEEEMISHVKLETIMKQRMGATDKMVESIKELANEQQNLGVIGNEVVVAGAQQLATYLNQTDSLHKLIPAMNNLAAQQKGVNATSGDLVNIGNMMGKVFTGQVGALRRVGISFTDAQEQVLKYGNETEKAAMLAEVITDNVGEMNKSLANTSPGRIAQLKNSFGDLQKEFGRLIIPLRDAFVPVLQRVVVQLGQIIDRLKPAIQYATVFLNTLFGNKAITSSKNAAGALGSQAEAYEDIEEAAKAATKQLFGFDEINQSQDKSADTGLEIPAIQKAEPVIETMGLIDGLDSATKSAKEFKNSFESMARTIKNNSDIVKAAIAGIATAFISLKIAMNWGAITAAIKPVWIVITSIAGAINIWAVLIVAAIALIVAAIVLLWNRSVEFRNVVKGVLAEVSDEFKKIMVEIKKLEKPLGELGQALLELFDALSPVLVVIAGIIGVGLVNNIRLLTFTIKVLVVLITEWVKIMQFYIDVTVKGVRLIADMFKSLPNAIKPALNTVIDFVNKIIKGIGKIGGLIGKIPGVGNIFGDSKIPEIPRLAQGGITGVNSPMPAIVGDNPTQPEVIAPLGDLVNILKDVMGGSQVIKLQIGSTEFEQVVSKSMRDYNRRTGGAFA
jgi:hypothetical protein